MHTLSRSNYATDFGKAVGTNERLRWIAKATTTAAAAGGLCQKDAEAAKARPDVRRGGTGWLGTASFLAAGKIVGWGGLNRPGRGRLVTSRGGATNKPVTPIARLWFIGTGRERKSRPTGGG